MFRFLVAFVFSTAALAQSDDLLTVAESSEFRATARHADVMAFCRTLAERSDLVTMTEFGRSFEDRPLPLLLVADPPVASIEEAEDSDRLVVLMLGNIHAGEVCGKEALLMLARDLALDATGESEGGDGDEGDEETERVLDHLILAIAPIYNADGNERMSPDNRPGQVGPEQGMGIRPNAQGLDLNRDSIKLESPEAQSLAKLMRDLDPHVIIDTHTTNGSYHRYVLTYECNANPAGDPDVLEYVRDELLPDVEADFLEQTGWHSFLYGNFDADRTTWKTYPDDPRFGTRYRGIRSRISILTEAYSYAPYQDRVLATYHFVNTCLDHIAAQREVIEELITEADTRRPETVAIRSKAVPLSENAKLLTWELEDTDGPRPIATNRPLDLRVEHIGAFEPTLEVSRPWAYLYPASQAAVTENLLRHGIEVTELREDIELDVEAYELTEVSVADREFQGHRLVRVEAEKAGDARMIPAGTIVVETDQPLGTLAVYLLEPQAADGLTTWGYFGEELVSDSEFPVMRVAEETPMRTRSVRPLDEDRTFDREITFELMYESRDTPRLGGSALRGLWWLDDEHYIQDHGGTLHKIHAATGRGEPWLDTSDVRKALETIPTITKDAARRLTRRPTFPMSEDRSGGLFEHENDLYYATLDGATAVRLTSTPEAEELATFSPDGQFVAFVRENDLYVVDVATQTERALTTGGSDLVRNAKLDWVYQEEVYGRGRYRAYWWSPDSSRIVFLQIDSRDVKTFTVIDDRRDDQRLEETRYPRPGEPNPKAKIGSVTVAGGPVRWVELSDYTPTDMLITGVGWWPDSSAFYFYVQNRIQTWLDVVRVDAGGTSPKRLFRETTEAWVNNPPAPKFLEDDSFLILLERSGWQHVYRFDSAGRLMAQLTDGEWEARSIEFVDEEGGVLYISGTLDSPIGSHLYRVALLDETPGEEAVPHCLTPEAGTHRISMSEEGSYFIDTWSNQESPTRVALFATGGAEASASAERVRWLDTNPVYETEEFRLSKPEYVQIPTPEGHVLEGTITLPQDFDPRYRYPVFFQTYAGPHAPTIRERWPYDSLWDQMLAQQGIVIFRADPYSASGKGAQSAWTAYRQFAVPELRDIETAIDWICEKPYVDPSRIAMAGHSYGGFMTAYALTHSDKFAAGIAGAPVTDWREYDTIYTERYMSTPQDNPDGYKKTSPVNGAKNLTGRLLIAHGGIDDNVHFSNAVKLIDALQKADKQFDFMMYPGNRHGIWGKQYAKLRVDFLERWIGGPELAPEPTEDSTDEEDASP